MNKKYEEFVGCLRDELMRCLGLGEKQIYFEERDKNGMTPNGDRLFVEVRASAAGKEVCGIHTEELFEDYEDGVSVETIANTVAGEVLKLRAAGFFERTKNLNDYEKIKGDLFIRPLNRKLYEKELSKAVYKVIGEIALVLYMQVGKAENRIASMKIRRENLNEWGLSTETVFDTALLNTYFISPPRIYLWEEMLSNPDYSGECFMDLNNDFQIDNYEVGNCLSTVRKTNGGVAIFLPGVAQRLAYLLNGDFYVVFTSIHEAMIHGVDSLYPPEDLERILKETIMEATPEEDFLTDKIYKYSRKTGTFWIYKDGTFFNLGVPEFLEPERKM